MLGFDTYVMSFIPDVHKNAHRSSKIVSVVLVQL